MAEIDRTDLMLERFRVRWEHRTIKKLRKTRNLERGFDSIKTEHALEILKTIQGDMRDMKHELASQSLRIAALEDHFRGTLNTLYSIQADVSVLKERVDRIELRMGLKDTEH